MEKRDIAEVADVWRLIGLHEAVETIATFMQVDPDGFAVAVSQETGECTAAVTAGAAAACVSCRARVNPCCCT